MHELRGEFTVRFDEEGRVEGVETRAMQATYSRLDAMDGDLRCGVAERLGPGDPMECPPPFELTILFEPGKPPEVVNAKIVMK